MRRPILYPPRTDPSSVGSFTMSPPLGTGMRFLHSESRTSGPFEIYFSFPILSDPLPSPLYASRFRYPFLSFSIRGYFTLFWSKRRYLSSPSQYHLPSRSLHKSLFSDLRNPGAPHSHSYRNICHLSSTSGHPSTPTPVSSLPLQ